MPTLVIFNENLLFMKLLKYIFPIFIFCVLGNSGLQAQGSFMMPGSVSEAAWTDGTEVFNITRSNSTFAGIGGGSFIEITPSLDLPNPGLVEITSGQAFTVTLPEATGGSGAYTYAFSPTIPGLSFNAATRVLSGTVSSPATVNASYQVTDDASTVVEQPFTIVVHARPVLPDPLLNSLPANYIVGMAISDLTLPAGGGGKSPLTYTLTGAGGSALPDGLAFDVTTRILSGTPTTMTSGAVTLTYRLMDDNDAFLERTFDITIDPVAQLTMGDMTVDEDVGTAAVEVTLNNAVAGGFTITAATANGTGTANETATAGDDYTATTQTLTFTGTANEIQTLMVPITNDNIVEFSENFTVSLSGLAGTSLLISLSDTRTVTITDNDRARVSLVSLVGGTTVIGRSTDVNESAGSLEWQLVLDNAVVGGFRFRTTTVNGSSLEGHDYTRFDQTIIFEGYANETHMLPLSILNDDRNEPTESFQLRHTNVGAAPLLDVSWTYQDRTIFIADDDIVRMIIEDVTVDEDAGTAEVRVTKEGNTTQTSRGVASTSNGTAIAGEDYTETTSGALLFQPSDILHTFTVPIIADDDIEGTETFTVSLDFTLMPEGFVAASADIGTVTILDNESAALTVGDVTVDENAGTAAVVVTLNNAVAGGFTVMAATADETATAGEDYTTTTATFTFAGTAGETQTLTVPIINDNASEDVETITVSLSGLAGTTLLVDITNTGTVTITDDDNPPTANAGEDQAVFVGTTVTLTGSGTDPDGNTVTYQWTQTGGMTVSLNDAAIANPTFTAPINLLTDAVLTFSLTVNDGNDTASATVTITVLPVPLVSLDDFVTTWRVAAGDLDITIPTTGTGTGYNYTVVWGDGTVDANQTGDITHTYTAAADYEVFIIGDFPRIFFNNASGGNKDKIIDINQWGTQVWTSMERSFYGATNMTVTATDAPDLSVVTDMRFMFTLATSFNQDISGWDVSNITSMGNMFDRATSFNQDISGWVTSRLTNTSNMFKDATAFNQNIGGWNVSSLTIMHTMFNGATAFNQDIGMWNVGAVTDMSNMFRDATSFNQDIGTWDVGNVTLMINTFLGAADFNQDIGGWNVGAVTDMNQMFMDATVFNQNIGGWNVGAVTNMQQMFSGVADFDQDIGGWNVGAVTNMQQMFSGVAAFDQDIGGWNVGAVTNMQHMFQDATAFNQDIGGWNVGAVTLMINTFLGATAFDQDIGGWNVGAVTNMTQMFSAATAFDQDISTWDVSNVTTMASMFTLATSFNQDIGGWDVGAVTNMNSVFNGATAFDQDIGGWNVGAVINMNSVFNAATAFDQDIGAWDVGAVTNMQQMFSAATAFDQDIGGWNVGAVTNMTQMFSAATAFDQDIGGWNVSNVTTMASMLDNSGLSDTNYDNLLTGWAALTLQPDVTLGAAGINYCTGAAGRTILAGTPNNWIITDAGLLCGTDITAFSFTEQTGAAVIDEVAHTVVVGVVAGTPLTALTPTIAVSSGATIAPASGAAQDFSTNVAYTVTAQDGVTPQQWTVTVTVNVAPSDIALANSSIDENNAVNDVIGGLSATDANTSDTHTYSLVAGTGDTDNASFTISGSDLVAAAVFDYETKSTYSVRIAVDDGKGGTFEKAFALTVTDVMNASQTITFGALAAVTSGGASFELTATASSGLPVSYSSSDVSVASVSGSTVTIVGTGTTDITASQAGDIDYAAATDVTQSLVVKQAQTITFNALAAVTFGGADFDPGATASSTLNVSYSSSDALVASVSGNMVTIVGAGTTVITASQTGDADYIAAPDVAQDLVVNQADQTITLTPVTNKVTTDAPFNVAASSTSGLPVTLTVSGGPATISAATLTLDGTSGTVTITAGQAGNNNYNAATTVAVDFEVTRQAQTITFGALAAMTFGGADFNLAATASSGLLLSYSSSAPSVASIAGNTVTIEGAGTTIITASQTGDADYIAAPDVTQDLVVNQGDQTITLTPVTDKETTDAPFEVAASSTSRLPVTFTVGGPATISGATLTLTGTEGTVTITADQAGNSNYNTAPSVEESFDVVDMRTVTGLEEEAPANKILLHPIPANNTIYIDMGDQKLLEMTVTDLNGKQMTVHAKDSQLDISSLKEGYYILRITTDQGVFSQKIIKQ